MLVSQTRWLQGLQIAIERTPRPFVPFCSHFSFQLCSLTASLVPAFQEVRLVGINQTGPLLTGTRVRDRSSRNPPLNGSLGYTQLKRNLSNLHAFFLECHDLLIPSGPLSLTRLLCVLHSSCSGWTPFS